jgi:hypothetical protein
VIDPTLVYSTYLAGTGGSYTDDAAGIAVDASGNAYVTGSTYSVDFPTTPGGFQLTYRGKYGDAFVTKLNAAGSALVYSTYLGGSDADTGKDIRVDSSGNAYVIGETASPDFPTTPGAYLTSPPVWASFLTKLNAAGSALVYSTYISGVAGGRIAIDASGSAYVTGTTSYSLLPTTPGAFQTALGGSYNYSAFVMKLNASGSALIFSTYLGGSGDSAGYAIAVDAWGNAYITGHLWRTDFPITPAAFQTSYRGWGAAFVSKLNASGTGSSLLYVPSRNLGRIRR